MKAADAIPRPVLSFVGSFIGAVREGRGILAATRISREDWRDLARSFPGLGPDPGPRAARARLAMEFLAGRALSTARHGPVWRGGLPPATPTLYVTAHLGDLRALRYLLRTRVPAGSIIAPENEERPDGEAQDRLFDERFPRAFPHVFPSREAHRIRAALREGSLIAAADAPAEEAFEAPLLQGTLRLDPRPFRLARLAGVSSRPLFLTAPGTRLTVTLGEVLPEGALPAIGCFAQVLARVAQESPWDWDGATHLRRMREGK